MGLVVWSKKSPFQTVGAKSPALSAFPFLATTTAKFVLLSDPSTSVSLSTNSLVSVVVEERVIVPPSVVVFWSFTAIGSSFIPVILTVITPVSVAVPSFNV